MERRNEWLLSGISYYWCISARVATIWSTPCADVLRLPFQIEGYEKGGYALTKRFLVLVFALLLLMLAGLTAACTIGR
ncbi:MAG: hypothetical protein M3Q29_16200, partial [Chloroflexota bacterium]|nr:hypothetical protein [Chloroflexota bacterium]